MKKNNLAKKICLLVPKQLWLQMKIATILLILTTFCLQANDSFSQNVKVSLNMQNTTITDIFREIENQTDYRFFYNKTLLNTEKRVSVNSNEKEVSAILNQLLAGENVSYLMINNYIVITPKEDEKINSSGVTQDNRKTVIGTVTDEFGDPIIGANIIEKGTTNGTVTDIDGKFNITVSTDAVIQFSYIGYKNMEILIGNQTIINVQLQEDTETLEEVVVVGYGIQRKVNLTGAVSMINFDQELENRPITNASQALSGKIPGIWVNQNSGKPGSDGALIRVRGWGTLNNSNPLIIIDGVEGDFNQINPNDIESISVLKDAASSAIYGSKAANGVILIKTKMGNQNEKMQVNLSSYYGIQALGKRYDVVNNSAEHMRLTNQALVNEGASPLFSENMISAFENGTDSYKYPNTDWFDELFERSPIQEHNLSIRGGTERSTTFLSVNYLNQDGMVASTNTKRYGIRANVELQVNNWFKISGRINYNNQTSKEPYNDPLHGSLARVFEMLSGVTPYTAPYTRDGQFGAVEAITEDGNVLYDNRNPLIDAANGRRIRKENFLTINTNTEIKLKDFLSWNTTFSSIGHWYLNDNYNQSLLGYTDSGLGMMTKNYNRDGLEISRGQVSTIVNSLFSTLNFNKKFANNHEFSSVTGMQLEDRIINNVYSRRSDPPKEGLTQVDAGTSGIQGAGNMNGLRMFSFFGRLNYSLKEKYLFEANLRADASSRFKEGNRWGIFPGLSAGWRLGEEPFIKDLEIFSNLKFRASWGKLGNQNIADYWPFLTTISQSEDLSYNYNDSYAPGAGVTSIIDEKITWEKTSTLDIGIDMGFLNNRLTIEADYFNKITSDIIVQLPIPGLMGGLTPPHENLGKMKNKGFEFNINFENQKINRNHFGYNLGLNLTYIDNKVTKFQGGKSPDQLYLIREGFSYQTLYGYKVVGIYQSDKEAKEHMHSNSYQPIAGNLKFEDVNSDGKLGFEDKQDIGNTIPKYSFGFTTGFEYKGFNLNLLFQGLADVNAYKQNNFTNMSWENRVISTRWRDAWTPENRNTNTPILYFNNIWDNQQSSYWVQNLSFLKLKNVQLGYSLPTNTVSKLGLQKLYLYTNIQNAFSIVNHEYEGYDPETNTLAAGVNMYPTPIITSFGLSLTF